MFLDYARTVCSAKRVIFVLLEQIGSNEQFLKTVSYSFVIDFFVVPLPLILHFADGANSKWKSATWV
jgi:hypothetical protein